jgi:hypothetical protein
MEHPVTNDSRKAKKLNRTSIFLATGILFAVAAFFGTLCYGIYFKQWESPFVRKMASVFGIAAAKVGKDEVPYVLYLAHTDAAREIIKQPYAKELGAPDMLTPQLKSDALDFAIRTVAVEQFAQERNVQVMPLDVDRAFGRIRDQAGTSTSPEEIRAILETQFGMDEEHFKAYIVRPAVLEDLLKQKALDDTKQPDAFTNELDERLKKTDVVRYLKF